MAGQKESTHTCTDPACLHERGSGISTRAAAYLEDLSIPGNRRLITIFLLVAGFFRHLCQLFRLSLLRHTRLSGGCGGRRDNGRLLRGPVDIWQSRVRSPQGINWAFGQVHKGSQCYWTGLKTLTSFARKWTPPRKSCTPSPRSRSISPPPSLT